MQVELNDGFNWGNVRTVGLFQLIHFVWVGTKAPWQLIRNVGKLSFLIESSESASSKINSLIRRPDNWMRQCIVCCRDRTKELEEKLAEQRNVNISFRFSQAKKQWKHTRTHIKACVFDPWNRELWEVVVRFEKLTCSHEQYTLETAAAADVWKWITMREIRTDLLFVATVINGLIYDGDFSVGEKLFQSNN